jgi:hypothetical protein
MFRPCLSPSYIPSPPPQFDGGGHDAAWCRRERLLAPDSPPPNVKRYGSEDPEYILRDVNLASIPTTQQTEC